MRSRSRTPRPQCTPTATRVGRAGRGWPGSHGGRGTCPGTSRTRFLRGVPGRALRPGTRPRPVAKLLVNPVVNPLVNPLANPLASPTQEGTSS